MRIYYDTEFHEDGQRIELLSIGMVRQDGQRLYRVISDHGAISRAVNHDWLRENVVRHLPVTIRDRGPEVFGYRWSWAWDYEHSDYEFVYSRAEVADHVRDFVLGSADPELWAWYGAYDHVAICQLFGRMIDLPDGFPMFTCDIRQEAARTCCDLRQEDGPVKPEGVAHNALHDAIWDLHAHEWLIHREHAHLDSSAVVIPFIWPLR